MALTDVIIVSTIERNARRDCLIGISDGSALRRNMKWYFKGEKMKKRFLCLTLATVMCASLAACGKTGSDEKTTDLMAVASSSEVATSDEAAEATTSATEATTKAVVVAENPEYTGWVMQQAPAVRNVISDEEKLQSEMDILSKGTVLFEGKVDEGYYPGDISWLTGATKDSKLVAVYGCDDETHAGWGVLGLKMDTDQIDIKAESNEPAKQRLLVYSVEELCEIDKVSDPSEIKSFCLGAWNGGHIHGLYLLTPEVAAELDKYLADTAAAEAIQHSYDGTLSNENASENAVNLYKYLCDTYAAGGKCITGQMESTWMGSPDYEMDYVKSVTGKLPAIRGLDFMHNDFDGVADRAIAWWEQGGISTICWHTGPDFASGYNESKDVDLDWENALTPGTKEYEDLLAAMDRAVPALQKLKDAGVPVLWRPFHELDGGWFWWTRGGSENFTKLWQMMYSRYTDYWQLDNLIWVFGYSGNGGDLAPWYPGDDFVDLIGADSYTYGANGNLFKDVTEVSAEGMPIVFHECGTIPTEEQMVADNANWLYFMVWHTDYITDEKNNTKELLNEVYNSDYFITLDELPAFK